MVVARDGIVQRAMEREGLSPAQLAGRMDVSQKTVHNILAGKAIGSRAQIRLFNAFNGRIPFTRLFEVVADEKTRPERKPRHKEAVA